MHFLTKLLFVRYFIINLAHYHFSNALTGPLPFFFKVYATVPTVQFVIQRQEHASKNLVFIIIYSQQGILNCKNGIT